MARKKMPVYTSPSPHNPRFAPIPTFDALLDRLSDRLQSGAPLPGHTAHRSMSPRLQARSDALTVEERACREAGVLALLLPPIEDPILILTVRHDELPDHGGQISFPGGQREGTESLSDTALREAQEEIGISTSSVRLLGTLTPLYIPPSNYCVHPFLGAATVPLSLHPTDREVDQILRVPIHHLLNPDTRKIKPWTLHDQEVDVPYYDANGHKVWGATAMMLAEVLSLLRTTISPK